LEIFLRFFVNQAPEENILSTSERGSVVELLGRRTHNLRSRVCLRVTTLP